jgi:hypothetical protein
MVGCVEIQVEYGGSFELFVEYMFRILDKDIIKDVGTSCVGFEKLKKMNIMIPEIHENMWTEKLR